MKRKLRLALILIAVSIFLPACLPPMRLAQPPKEAVEISVIPKPAQIEQLTGNFAIAPATQILIPANDRGAELAAQYLADRLKKATGFDLPIQNIKEPVPFQAIVFRGIYNPGQSPEDYQLSVSTDRLTIEATQARGFFYGVQTLLQLLPPQIYSGRKLPSITILVPCLKINDTPRFAWRGMMLDVSRHFFPKEFVKDYIDYLAMHKMNTFHWHLTDDQGWRVEIKKYPKLTEIGAWRVNREDKDWNNREPQKEGKRPPMADSIHRMISGKSWSMPETGSSRSSRKSKCRATARPLSPPTPSIPAAAGRLPSRPAESGRSKTFFAPAMKRHLNSCKTFWPK